MRELSRVWPPIRVRKCDQLAKLAIDWRGGCHGLCTKLVELSTKFLKRFVKAARPCALGICTAADEWLAIAPAAADDDRRVATGTIGQ
ncbi:MAG TPA: hypothetical protein VGL61_31385 [Kofleriaceae bacterium]|jgi:hypothetical protein